ncbi:D-alanyl-D-alanine carboxypeptidase/D-alanyl-D-alanine-endopeptidase [Streptomyces brevispora]|uniref:D-alanyl-D-alanine carboxypeptidase/D-alanyl-D-alanine-endopeptidase n=1 Tax=Streptomyces brevispora TaxID=887462 RepID=A0A561UXA8_9ACTN|nr:D-alanyl-D-alanine carboxypeptidase/D-alanyl-D-alanine-endopeptidase [Streptomyces brevispora]TWG03989.1 D-alanyl-D-alanine carboxypeptidase/D-alanyl-D-alanine-endopeptidase (penicillin-binding protein 4) [Streptomyces brevispora]WSC14983.1 D-alanyl-D-alanine carboxypeptidase/D-alanyl-D-alanine-endopeptidase [Streptomyces brevispora]
MAEPVKRPSIKPFGKLIRATLTDHLDLRNGLSNWQFTAVSAALGLALAAGAVLAAGPWDSGQRKAELDWAAARARTGGAHHDPAAPDGPAPAPSAPAVLAALGTAADRSAPDAPDGAAAELRAVLGPLLKDPALGTRPSAVVIDTATGKRLYGKGADTPMTPASTVKIATTVAALTALGPDHRIPTTVRASADSRTVTLVGGGDPTLDRAALRSLAADTARALKDSGVHRIHLRYDASGYSGPALHPIGPNENIAPVSALMVNEGRLDDTTSGPAPRSGDPARAAADAFGELLGKAGITTGSGPASGRAAAKSRAVAKHLSAPLSGLVERALTNSDNDIAEALARQTALVAGRPADFNGGRQAVTAQLSKLKLPLKGANFADGSGLNRQDKVTAALLAGLLARTADPDHPELRPVLSGLPVAGFSGTLSGRYTTKSGGTGLIRAKTGTLTGVNTLSGTVVDAHGRLLAFAFLASGTTDPSAAQSALDSLATALAAGKR